LATVRLRGRPRNRWQDKVRENGRLVGGKKGYITERNGEKLLRTARNRHILRRNYLLQGVTEGKIKGGIDVTGRRGRRRRKLLDDCKERREYFHLKEEVVDRTMWRSSFGRGFGPVVRQTTK
jgi:hypothetical protein